MTTAEQIRVAIIGCGLIGTEWDRTVPTGRLPLTHARAFMQHARAHLVALCDRDAKRARDAANYWQVVHAYTDPEQLFAEHDIDVVIIATPSNVRSAVIEPALAAGIKLFVIEKPLATSLTESSRLVKAIDAAGAFAIINYSRNWDPSMREVRIRIESGAMGKMQRIVGTYGKGLNNNGSHLIDLAGLLCSASPVRARALNSPLDVSEADWTPTGDRAWDAQVEFIDAKGNSINLTLLGTDHRAFTCFELRAIGQKAIFELSMGGRVLKWTELQNDPNFPGYTVPSSSATLKARYMEAIKEMADEVVRLATGETTIVRCNAHKALRTALTIEAIQQSVKNDGLWVTLDSLSGDHR